MDLERWIAISVQWMEPLGQALEWLGQQQQELLRGRYAEQPLGWASRVVAELRLW
jgi:hypothetical protein